MQFVPLFVLFYTLLSPMGVSVLLPCFWQEVILQSHERYTSSMHQLHQYPLFQSSVVALDLPLLCLQVITAILSSSFSFFSMSLFACFCNLPFQK